MRIKYKIDVNTGAEIHADTIYKNEIAFCEISVGSDIVYDKFENNRELGSMILIDRVTNMTSACGVVMYPLARGKSLTWHNMDITRELRENQLGQEAFTIWMTGFREPENPRLPTRWRNDCFPLANIRCCWMEIMYVWDSTRTLGLMKMTGSRISGGSQRCRSL